MKSYLPIIASLFLVSASCDRILAQVNTEVIQETEITETENIASEINPYIKDNIATEISVKISSADNSGSGVIIAQDDNTYLVLTNNHLLRDEKEIAINTHDGITHQAIFVENGIDTDDDLALLQFTSDNAYQTATINTAATPRVKQTILAVGYSAETGELVTEAGKIERVPDKILKKGYSIGYSSNIVGGMSGGAIINTDGEVIGINGKSAFPIANTGYDLEDGTKPNAEEIEELRQLSWGLSINRLLARVNPDIITAYSLPLPETDDSIERSQLTGWLGELETKAKQITVRIDSSSGANGSGVIIAKEGNTYTVLTADHVICESEPKSRDCIDYSYDLLAPDGQKYSVNIETIKRQEGVDLATVRFTSNQDYQVAELANYPLTARDAVFVAGYPNLSKNTPAQWLFSMGMGFSREQGLLTVTDNSLNSDSSNLLDTQSGSLAGGYEMVYTSITYGGMSGGAILDSDGRVIGIHGLAEGQTALNSQSSSVTQIQLGYSLGMPINTFIGLADKLGMPELSVQENRAKALKIREVGSFQAATLGTEISEGNAKPELWLERGNQLWRLRRYDEAVEAFDRVIALNPEFVHLAHYGKSLALFNDRKTEAALISLELATETQPDFTAAFYLKNALLTNLERWREALVAIETAISLQPNNANYYSAKGYILSKLTRYDAAEAAYDRAISINPRSDFYGNRGILYQEQGKLDKALLEYNRVLKINPNLAITISNRGLIYQEQGKLDKALLEYNRAIEINPNLAEIYVNRSGLYSLQGKLELALSDLEWVLVISPNFAKAYCLRAIIYEKQGKLDKALYGYNRAIEINPNDADAYFFRGDFYKEQEKFDRALSDFNQVIQINPDYAAYIGSAAIYLELDNVNEAKFNLEKAQQLAIVQGDTQNAEEIKDWLQQISKLEQSESAQASKPNANPANESEVTSDSNRNESIDRSSTETQSNLGVFPVAPKDSNLTISNSANNYFSRGTVFFKQGQFELALSNYDKALASEPNNTDFRATVYYFRGAIYEEQGEYDLAIDNFNKALEISPNSLNSIDTHRLLSFSYLQKGDVEAAISNLEKAQQLAIAQNNTAGAEQITSLLTTLEQSSTQTAANISQNESIDLNNTQDYYDRADENHQGEYELALTNYNKAIQQSPNDIEAYYDRGDFYYERGELEKAISDFEQVIQLDSNHTGAYTNIGFIYRQTGNVEEAEFNLQKAQQLLIAQGKTAEAENIAALLQEFVKEQQSPASNRNPQSTNEYYNRAFNLHQKRQYVQAAVFYSKAIELDPNDEKAFINRGLIYFSQGKEELALADYNKAIAIDADNSAAYRNRGVLYFEQEKYELAKLDWNKAVEANPEDALTYYNRGFLYKELEDYSSAKSDFETAEKLAITQKNDDLTEKTRNALKQLP